MFGEFFCYLLSQDSSFYKDYKTLDLNSIADDNNRFLFPNYLDAVDFNAKTYILSDPWPITDNSLNELNEKFAGKNIAVPTHWFNSDLNICQLPGIGIRLHCKNKKHLAISYILHWLKSHQFANVPWPSRIKDLELLSNSNHPHKNEFRAMLENLDCYQNWKFLSYYHNILLEGKPNLKSYVVQRFHSLCNTNYIPSEQWYGIDIGEAIFNNTNELEKFNRLFGLDYSLDAIPKYKEKNLELIYDKLKLDISDPKFYFIFISKLLNYLEET